MTRPQCIALLRACDAYGDTVDAHWSDAELEVLVQNRRNLGRITDAMLVRVLNEMHGND